MATFEGSEKVALVIYHNKYAQARGWVRTSVGFNAGTGILQKSLADGLGLPTGEQDYAIFRDSMSGQEYIRSCRELSERGLYVELQAYKCHVFLDWRFVSGLGMGRRARRAQRCRSAVRAG